MQTISKRYIWIFFSVLIVVMAGAYLLNTFYLKPSPKPVIPQASSDETSAGKYYTVRDQSGLTIFQTGLTVHVDDRYINDKDVEYIIIKVDGQNAVAEILKKHEVSSPTENSSFMYPWNRQSIPAQAAQDSHVVVYHTHSDESYTPTSGTASKPGKGDIYQVGANLTDALQKSGISVTHSYNAHDPHDINAYHRSRKTLTQLLKEQPDAAFDIHRDSAPSKAYITTINGIETSKVMIVVGRGNPNMQGILNYAKKVKKEADSIHPGLMRGIFMGKGDYNQDLYPTTLLFEIGTENIPVELPNSAARLLADVLIRVISSK